MATAPPAPSSAAWLVQQLTDARVLDAVQIAPYLSEFRAAHPGGGSAALADFLAGAGLLTRYQADRVLAGEAPKLVCGPYLLLQPIGSGSLGTVYQAVNRNDRRKYALKILPLRSLWNVKQAKKQVQVLAGVPPHPAILPFVDVDSAAGMHYLAWPHAAGSTLDKYVANSGPLPVPQAVSLLAQLAEALDACHARQLVHGLLKPSNIMMGDDGQPRILDLGVGAILMDNIADDESMLDTISTANVAMGLLDCASPETINDPTLRTTAGDVYSLGCVAYFALTGHLPFEDGNAIDKILAHQTQPPASLRSHQSAIPAWLDDTVLAMLKKNPVARPTTAGEVLARLKFNEAAPPTLPPPPPAVPAPPTADAHISRLTAPRAVRPASVVDFEMPDDEIVPHGSGAIAAPPQGSGFLLPNLPPKSSPAVLVAGGSDPRLAAHDPWGPVPVGLHPTPVALAAPPQAKPTPIPTAAEPLNLSALPTPVEYTTVGGPGRRKRVQIPPPPDFAAQVGWRFANWLAFWKTRTDVVQLTAFGPAGVSPGESFALQVFAHQPGAFESVCTLSRAFHQNGELLATGFVQVPMPRGGDLGMHLSVANAGVAKSLAQLNWLGQPQPRGFEVHVPWESHAGLTRARLSAGVNGILAGQIEFEIQIHPRSG